MRLYVFNAAKILYLHNVRINELYIIYVYFIMSDLVYCFDWNIITLNGRSVIMNFLL